MQRLPLKHPIPLILTATSLYILSLIFSTAYSDQDYVFRTANNDEVHLPEKPVISIRQPRALAPKAAAHTPSVEIKSRKDGLENVRVLVFHFAQLPEATDNDRLKAIYLIDKDGLIVGFGAIPDKETTVKVVLNGVINYVKVYIECSKHGLWMEELNIPL